MIGLPGRMSGDLLQVVSYSFGSPGVFEGQHQGGALTGEGEKPACR
jgi:hypothetical protein